jgi:AcrR family transcriptional regulator
MVEWEGVGQHRPIRADARRNRRRLVDAAIELILETGGEPSRDAVAQRAEVGIGTLYRHFPDQQALLSAVVLDVLDRTIEQGNAALAESADGGEALRRYMHATIDTRLGVVNIVYAFLENRDWPDRRADAQRMLDKLIAAVRRDGAIGVNVTAADIAFATIRFGRPLAVGLGAEQEQAIAHRQLDTYLDGLLAPPRPTNAAPPAHSRRSRRGAQT